MKKLTAILIFTYVTQTCVSQTSLGSALRIFAISTFYNMNVYKTKTPLTVKRVYDVSADTSITDSTKYIIMPLWGRNFIRYKIVEGKDDDFIRILPGTVFLPMTTGNIAIAIAGTTAPVNPPPTSRRITTTTTTASLPATTNKITSKSTTISSSPAISELKTIASTTSPKTEVTSAPTITAIVTPTTITTNETTTTTTNTLMTTSIETTTSGATAEVVNDMTPAETTIETVTTTTTGNIPITIGSDASAFYFQIVDDITPNNHYMASQTIMGMPITLPVKLRTLDNVTNIEMDLSVGYAFGYKIKCGNNPYRKNYINIIPYAVSLNKDSYFYKKTDGGYSEKEESISLTYCALGAAYEYYGLNLGVFVGWDRMFNTQKNWVYQNKPWVSLGIGYKIGKAE